MILRTALLLLVSLPALAVHAATWTSNGPAGGATRALVAAEENARLMYVASAGGLFRTDDGGVTWKTITGPVVDPVVLAIAPSDPGVVLAATRAGVLHRSDDHGTTWRVIGAGLPPAPEISAITIDPRNANVVYAGTRCGAVFGRGPVVQWHEKAGVFKSVDGGTTFANASAGLAGFQLCVEELALDPLHADTVYVTPLFGDSGFPRSDDGGATWVASPTRVPGGGAIVDPSNANVLYGTARGEFLRSENRGATWELQLPTVLPTGRVLPLGTVTSFALDPAVPRFFFGGIEGAYRSGDRGASVLPLGGAGRERIDGIVFDPATGVLTIGTNSGVYQSFGWPWDEWRMVDTGDRSLPTLDVLPSRLDAPTAFAISSRDVHVTRDSGRSWAPYAPPLPGDHRPLSVAIDASDAIYALGEAGNAPHALFRWTAGGSEWTRTALPVVNGRFLRIYVDNDDPTALYVAAYSGFGTYDVLFRTRDGGTTWENAPSIVRPWSLHGHVVSPSDPNVLYVVGGASGPALQRSADRGVTWSAMPLPVAEDFPAIAVDPRDANTIYIASWIAGVFRSRDGGASWTSITGNIPDGIRKIALSDDGKVLHAATDSGVWELRTGPARIRAVR